MTSKPLIAELASIAAMSAVLWSLPAAADMGGAAVSSMHQPHDKWPGQPGHLKQAAACTDPDDTGPRDGDHDCDDGRRVVSLPDDGGWMPTALLVLGLGGVWLTNRYPRQRDQMK